MIGEKGVVTDVDSVVLDCEDGVVLQLLRNEIVLDHSDQNLDSSTCVYLLYKASDQMLRFCQF